MNEGTIDIKILCPKCDQLQCHENYRSWGIDCETCGTELVYFSPAPEQSTLPPGQPPPVANTQYANLTAGQFAALESSIKATLKQFVVKDIRLAHVGGTKYKAHLTIMTAQGEEQCVADVNFDGVNFVWQILDATAKRDVTNGTVGFRLLGSAIALFFGWLFYAIWNESNNGELAVALARAGASAKTLHWKEYFYCSGCIFGVTVGLSQLITGRSFERLPWLKIVCFSLLGFALGAIQRL